MKRFHIALAVGDVEASIADYTQRLGAEPELVIPGQYALWRTTTINFSIRLSPGMAGTVRHLGWEDSQAETLSVDHDINGMVWEHFSATDQRREVQAAWPRASRGGCDPAET